MSSISSSSVRRAIALGAGLFGIVTIFAGGSVALDLGDARVQAGHVVPFVVWFNFFAGFAYVVAAVGIWADRSWARRMASLIAVATALVAVGFAVFAASGQAFELRTVGALGVRFALWTAIALWLARRARA